MLHHHHFNIATEEEVPVVVHDLNTPAEPAKAIEPEIVSSFKEAIDIIELGDDIIDAIHDSGTAGSIQARMAVGPEQTSLEAVKMCRITMESMRKRLKLGNEFIMPAMECFENKHETALAYQVSMEGIGGIIINIWRAIKNAVATLWKKIKDFFYQLFGTMPRLERNIKALQEKAKDLGTPTQDRFVDKELQNSFNIDGKITSDGVISILDTHLTTTSDAKRLSEFMSDISVSIKELTDKMKREIGDFDKRFRNNPGENERKAIGDAMVTYAFELKKEIESQSVYGQIKATVVDMLHLVGKTMNERNAIARSMKRYIDGKYLVLYETKKPDTGSFSLEIEIMEPDEMDKFPKDLSVLRPGDMSIILTKCEKLLKMRDTMETILGKLDDVQANFIRVIDSVEDSISACTHNPDMRTGIYAYNEVLDDIRLPIASMMSVISRVYTALPTMNIYAVQRAVKYVEASMSYYR
jgi:hypothetical protein